MLYRFIGSSCMIGDVDYNRLGEKAEFSADTASQVVTGGGAFIPDSDFQEIGFTQAECDVYPNKGGYPEAPAELVAKRARAEVLLHETRSRLMSEDKVQ